MNVTRYSTSGHARLGSLSILRKRLRGVELRLQQIAIGALQLRQRVAAEAAAHEPDGVEAIDPAHPAGADGLGERQCVLRDHRIATDERITARPDRTDARRSRR